jgi:hypothetical protein
MKIFAKYIAIAFVLCTLNACERVIDLDLPKGEPIPYLDAWITTDAGVQTIKFLKAVNYMDNKEPEPIPGAQISVTDVTIGQTYVFNYANGAYSYDPGSSASIGVIGHAYKLNIVYNGETFEATNEIKRNTVIDSITYKYQEEKNDEDEGYYAKLYARDLPGAADYYWIRTYRNDKLNQYVGEMLSIDGSYSEDISDGFDFIPPFREGITSGEKPYLIGDKVKVQIRSLTKSTHNFMEQVAAQLSNNGLFAEVLQNVPTNVTNLQPAGKTKIYGWFGTVAQTEATKVIQ